jgi:4-amino-4-deoxy-L-arabinose transferase-like glycosyltransferase
MDRARAGHDAMSIAVSPVRLGRGRALARRFGVAPVAIGAVVVLQVVVMSTLHNTAFQDEALYLYAGRQYLDELTTGRPVVEDFSSYFSGLPYFYPVVAACLDAIGGLEAARWLSTAFAVIATCCVFGASRTLVGERAAIVATVAFAVCAPVVFVGRLATYDALGVALVSFAVLLASRAGRHPFVATFSAVVILGIATAAKYASAAFAPAVLLIVVAAPGMTAVRRLRAVSGGLVGLCIVATAAALLVHEDPTLLTGLTQTTTGRHVAASDRLAALLRVVQLAGVQIGIALLGAAVLIAQSVRRRPRSPRNVLLAAALVVGLVVAPAYHVQAGELVSLDKHLAFATVFAAPLIGLTLTASLERIDQRSRWVVPITAVVVMITLGIGQVAQMYRAWPDSSGLQLALRETVRASDTRVLAEEVEVPKYYLADRVLAGWQLTGLDFFQYEKDGALISGVPAYDAAIEDGYFGVIAFRYGPSAALATQLTATIRASGKYEEIVDIPFQTSTGDGSYRIWRRTQPLEEH